MVGGVVGGSLMWCGRVGGRYRNSVSEEGICFANRGDGHGYE